MPRYQSRLFSQQTLLLPVLLLCLVHSALGGGCSSRMDTGTIRADISSGNLESLETNLEATRESFEEFVTACNLARVYQMKGRWADSIKSFENALVLLEDYESRAVVNMRTLLAKAGTALFSRGAEEYYGVGYERSLLHTFNALNYLMLGDFSGAAVEMRRMNKRQEIWLEESQARIAKHLESEKRLDSPDDLPAGYTMRDLLRDDEVRSLVNNYQDPFSYSLGAIVYRLAGDLQSADVCMRRAIAMNEAANILFSHAWPDQSASRKKAAAGPTVPRMALPGSPDTQPETQEVTLVAFSGLVPALRVENVRVWFPAIGYIKVDLPSYTPPVSGEAPRITSRNGTEASAIELYPLLRTDVLAYRTLWDELSMEVTFAISRAAARAGVSAATYTAAHVNKDTRDFAPLIASLTTVLMDIFSSSMAKSLRNWETLPNAGYLAVTAVPRGSAIAISGGGDTTSVDLPLEARGVIIMVTELSNSNLKVNYVTY